MKKLSITCFLVIFSMCSLYAQSKTIKGRVIDEHLENLPYVSIMINDTIEVGKTDLKGFFLISIPVSVQKISFNAVGVDLASAKVVDECDEVEIVMMLSSTYDFMTPKRVERLQLKRLRKLPELHQRAFEKGLFKTNNPCYERAYMSHGK